MGQGREQRVTTKRIRVYGIVQGVGFRPFVSRVADRIGLTGSVANRGSYVEIFVKGTSGQQSDFLYALEHEAPERSAILKVDVSDHADLLFDSFDIIESEREEGDIFVSPDIATCPQCRRELFDSANRRYLHPFINCTACGPRLTILDAMPYDRERTSMKEFPMCPECEYEYTHAETRRYDAQPVCCNDCGPEVYLPGRPKRGAEAITAVRKAICEGKIIAVKGIGGFHLCCDATNEEALRRLRRLKQRPAKPFAVMMRDLTAVRRECRLSPREEEILDGHQKPIILLEKKKNSRLAPSVAPDNPNVGVMLPYAPVQMLLFDYEDDVEMTTDSFVMTSGNAPGAPISRTESDAKKELGAFCDLILSHNRHIRLRADDSVMSFYKNEPYMIRRSRGYAPLPVMMENEWKGQVLAVGGELKNTFCIAKDQLYYSSPYVGDMADARTVEALAESIARMEELLEAKPRLAVCDLHPKYNTTAVAEAQGLPLLKVQHHYAHILSCMAENNVPAENRVIGVSFDGTGYGTDGSIWGGEILTASCSGFERAGSIAPFLQIGGDASAREGWRIAVSMINSLYPDDAGHMARELGLCEPRVQRLHRKMAAQKINAVTSTSAGRLFDAVSAILGIRSASTFEGEASMTLQFRAQDYLREWEVQGEAGDFSAEKETDGAIASGQPEGKVRARCPGSESEESGSPSGFFSFTSDRYERKRGDPASGMNEKEIAFLTRSRREEGDGRILLPTDNLVRYIAEKRLAGEDAGRLAFHFHVILARQIIAGCRQVAEETGLSSCALSGGVFQNELLLELCEEGLAAQGLTVYRHRLIPPNDGGLALGQAVAGMEYLNQRAVDR